MKLKNEKEAMELFMENEYLGLQEILRQVEEMEFEKKEEIINLLNIAFKMDYILVESETEEYIADLNSDIQELAQEVLNKIFDILEIDIEKYWD